MPLTIREILGPPPADATAFPQRQTRYTADQVRPYEGVDQSNLRPFMPGEYVDNGDGSQSTERSLTVPLPSGEWANIPSLWIDQGGPVDFGSNEDAATGLALDYERRSGRSFPRFPTVDAGIAAARARSDGRGAFQGMLAQNTGGSRKIGDILGRPPELRETLEAASAPLPPPLPEHLAPTPPSPSGSEPQEAGGGPPRGSLQITDLELLGDYDERFIRGLSGVASSTLRGVGELYGLATGQDATQTLPYRAGAGLEGVTADVAPVDPARDDRFTAKLAEGAGSLAGFALGGAAAGGVKAGTAVTAGIGALSNAGDVSAEARAAGQPEKAGEAALWGTLPGATEALPIGRLLSRIDRISGGGVRRVIASGFKGGIEELAQEVLQAAANNVLAADVVGYDPDRGVFEGAPEAGAVGGTLGATLNFLATALAGRRGGIRTPAAVDMDPAAPDEAPIDEDDVPGGDVPETPPVDPGPPGEPVEPPLTPVDPDITIRPEQPPLAPPDAVAPPAPEAADPEGGVAGGAPPAPDAAVEPAGPSPEQIQAEAQAAAGQELQDLLDDPRPLDEILGEGVDSPPSRTATTEISRDGTGWKVTVTEPGAGDAVTSTVYRGAGGRPFASEEEAQAFARSRAVPVGTRERPAKPAAGDSIDEAASIAAQPTEPQAAAGNYQKGHIQLHGLDISVETPRGQTRSGTAPDGSRWSVEMPAHYGYVRRTEGADGDHVDVYLGPQAERDLPVYVVDQIDPATGKFDEHKVMLGYPTPRSAVQAYDAAFSDQSGPRRRGAITRMSLGQFKEWIRKGDATRPVRYRTPPDRQPPPTQALARDDSLGAPQPGTFRGSRVRGDAGQPNTGTLPATPKKIRSMHKLVERLNKHYSRIPLRQGRVGSGNPAHRGSYFLRSGVVRVRNMAELETVAHEFGHAVEDLYGAPVQGIMQQFQTELRPLDYDPMRADPVVNLKEGFAEAVRMWVINPQYLQRNAPGFKGVWEDWLRDNDPEAFAMWTEVQQGAREWLEAPSDVAVKATIVTTDGVTGRLTRTQRALRWMKNSPDVVAEFGHRLYAQGVDRTHIFRRLRDELEQVYFRNHKKRYQPEAIDDPYVRARLATDTFGAAFEDIKNGVIDYTTGKPGKGPSLAGALETAMGKDWTIEKFEDFGAYLVSLRALGEYERYFNGEIPNRPTATTYGDHIENVKAMHKRYGDAFKKGAAMVHKWANDLWRKKRDAGLISDADYKASVRDHPFYVPLLRDRSDVDGEPRAPGTGRKGQFSVVNRFKGSDRDIINPIESLMRDAYGTERAIADNDLKLTMLRLAEKAGPGGGFWVERIMSKEVETTELTIRRIQEAMRKAGKIENLRGNLREAILLDQIASEMTGLNADLKLRFYKMGEINEKGEPIVYAWQGGRRIAMRLADGDLGRQLYDALLGLDREQAGVVLNTVGAFAAGARLGVTLDPAFQVANAIRDAASSWVLVEGYNPLKTMFKGVPAALINDEMKAAYIAAGGPMGGQSTAALTKPRLDAIRDLKKRGINLKGFGSLRAYVRATEFTESATRLGIFKHMYERAKKRGLDDKAAIIEAAYEARDYIDFGRTGSKTLFMRKAVSFLNASIQGLDKSLRVLGGNGTVKSAIRAYVKREAGYTLTPKEQRKLKASFRAWGHVMMIGVVGLALSYAYRDEPEYQFFSEEIRATHWIFRDPLTGNWVSIPKPFELAFLSNVIERAFAAQYHDNPVEYERMWRGLWSLFAPPFIPAIFGPPIEHWANKSFYDGSPLIPERLQGKDPSVQVLPWTSGFGQLVGPAIGVSPIIVDHYISGWGTSLGRLFLATPDFLKTVATGEFAMPEPEDAFVMRRFWRDWTRSNVLQEGFWDQMAAADGRMASAAATLKQLDSEDDREAVAAYLDSLEPDRRIYAAWRLRAPEKRYGNYTLNRMHPLTRTQELYLTVAKLRGEIRTSKSLSEAQRRALDNALTEYISYDMFNALRTVEAPGFTSGELRDLAPLEARISEISPEIAKTLKDRTRKLPSAARVYGYYPRLKEIAEREVKRLKEKD